MLRSPLHDTDTPMRFHFHFHVLVFFSGSKLLFPPTSFVLVWALMGIEALRRRDTWRLSKCIRLLAPDYIEICSPEVLKYERFSDDARVVRLLAVSVGVQIVAWACGCRRRTVQPPRRRRVVAKHLALVDAWWNIHGMRWRTNALHSGLKVTRVRCLRGLRWPRCKSRWVLTRIWWRPGSTSTRCSFP